MANLKDADIKKAMMVGAPSIVAFSLRKVNRKLTCDSTGGSATSFTASP
jgi:hypothetical protein